jgi:hypothetical protein
MEKFLFIDEEKEERKLIDEIIFPDDAKFSFFNNKTFNEK